MYKYGIELANELKIIPTNAKSPPKNVTVRWVVNSHSTHDNEPIKTNFVLIT